MQIIEIQFRDGRDERIEGDYLNERWNMLTDDPTAIQYAVYRVPRSKGDGYRVRGVFGESREDLTQRREYEQAERENRSQQAIDSIHAKRDWTYNGFQANHL